MRRHNAKSYTVANASRAVVDRAQLGLLHTQPYRPRANGKAGRLIQGLQAEWAYARSYRFNAERLADLPHWLHRYNCRRPHGGNGGAVPPPACKQPSWELQLVTPRS
ncbi:MAG: transposase [Chloroflexi bacterium]|nr:transposase [Chloroflexota bacterium]